MLARLRLLIALIAALLAAVVVPAHGQDRPVPADARPVAGGGAFVIQSCGEAGSAAGWSETTNNASTHVQTGINCPPGNVTAGGSAPYDYQHAGLWASDRLGQNSGLEAVPGDRAELSFIALAGTTITRVRWFRSVLKTADNSWQPYTALGSSSNIVDTCDYDPHVSTVCGVGADDWFPDDANFNSMVYSYDDLPNLTTTKVIAGVLCRDVGAPHICGNGFSLVNAEVQIFSAFLTIADDDAPRLGTPTGQAWTTDAFVNGTVPVTLSSTDLTGIHETRAYVDGQLVATTTRNCSYTRPRPCTDEPGATVDVPTSGLADGPHTLAVAAVDAADNETRVVRSTPLKVDNNAPAAPAGLSSPTPTSSTNAFSASWALPADHGTPIVAARVQVCQNGTCGAVQTASSLTAATGVSLPAPGSGTLRVWLVDEAGHEDGAEAATLTLRYAPPPPPPPPTTPDPPSQTPTTTGLMPTPTPPAIPTPAVVKTAAKLKLTTLRRRGRTVTVAGTLTARASGRITVRYRITSHGRTHTLTKRLTISRHAFRTTLALSPTYAAARSARVTVSYGGDADTTAQSRTATLHTRA